MMTAPMSFHLPLMYETISSKARMNAHLKANLRRFFAKLDKDYTKSFLRVSSNSKSKTARSTTYVISEGEINSHLCFAMSKYKCDKQMWITPNGWKTATIACGALFTAETRVVDGEMKFRFALVDYDDYSTEKFGLWDANLVTAFSTLDHMFTREMQTNLSKISKQLVCAVHCNGMQKMLVHVWETLKKGMSETQLQFALELESKPRLCEFPLRDPEVEDAALALTAVAATQKRARACGTSVISCEDVIQVFQQADSLCNPQAVRDLLYWLEAGFGARMDHVLHFYQLVEECVQNIWKQVQFRVPLEVCFAKSLGSTPKLWLAAFTSQPQQQTATLESKACLFVFLRMSQAFPTAESIHREKDYKSFLHKITLLPEAASVKQCLLGV